MFLNVYLLVLCSSPLNKKAFKRFLCFGWDRALPWKKPLCGARVDHCPSRAPLELPLTHYSVGRDWSAQPLLPVQMLTELVQCSSISAVYTISRTVLKEEPVKLHFHHGESWRRDEMCEISPLRVQLYILGKQCIRVVFACYHVCYFSILRNVESVLRALCESFIRCVCWCVYALYEGI